MGKFSLIFPSSCLPLTQHNLIHLHKIRWHPCGYLGLPSLCQDFQISAPHSVAIPGWCQVKLGMPAECSAYCQLGCPKPAQCFGASSVSVCINKVQNPKTKYRILNALENFFFPPFSLLSSISNTNRTISLGKKLKLWTLDLNKDRLY